MNPTFKAKPIPYSKLINNQLVAQNTSFDCAIPDEHLNLQLKYISKSSNNTIFQARDKDSQTNKNKDKSQNIHINKTKIGNTPHRQLDTNSNVQTNKNNQQSSFSRTFSFGPNESNSLKLESNKRLTHGLTNYQDIKESYGSIKVRSKNKSRNKSSENINYKSISKSGQKSKAQWRLQDQHLNKTDRQSIQCTFTPKTNNNSYRQSYKNFKDFVDFQQNFIAKRESKINRLKQQKSIKQEAQIKGIPQIDKRSKKLSESNESYVDGYGSLQKISKKPVYERLYNVPRKKDRVQEQSAFTPKILNKSKSLVRGDRVENLLYGDAQRRMQQQELLRSQEMKRQELVSTQSKYAGYSYQSTCRQHKIKNRLICKKIRTQFLQLLQNERQICQELQQQNKLLSQQTQISPILAITIISQLFNVQLNPNKNEQLCRKIIEYLISETSNANYSASVSKQSCSQYVEARRLWEFIKAIVAGTDGFQNQANSFTESEINNIHRQLGYFYSQRLSKQPTRYTQVQEQKQQFRISISKNTNRLAEIHRNRKLQQISQFISQTNIQMINTMFNKKNKANLTEDQQRTIRLQDLFILDSIRKKSQLEQKRLRNQQQQMKNYSFSPTLNANSIQKAKQRKNNSGRKHLKTIDQCNSQVIKQNSNTNQKFNNVRNEQKKCIVKISKNPNGLNSSYKENVKKADNQRQSKGKLHESIKNVDKVLFRQSIARKMRQVQAVQKERGYNSNSKNWLKQTQNKKKQICEQISNFLGYKDDVSNKQGYATNATTRQNFQSSKLK